MMMDSACSLIFFLHTGRTCQEVQIVESSEKWKHIIGKSRREGAGKGQSHNLEMCFPLYESAKWNHTLNHCELEKGKKSPAPSPRPSNVSYLS